MDEIEFDFVSFDGFDTIPPDQVEIRDSIVLGGTVYRVNSVNRNDEAGHFTIQYGSCNRSITCSPLNVHFLVKKAKKTILIPQKDEP